MPGAPALVLASVVVDLEKYFRARGLMVCPLFSAAALPPRVLTEPLSHVPLASVVRVLELASEQAGDDCLGLQAGIDMKPGWTGLLGHLALTAPTIGDGLKMLAAYSSLFISDVETGLEERAGMAYVRWRLPASVPAPRVQFNLFMAASIIERMRLALGAGWKPLAMSFDHREIACPVLVEQVFGDRVRYNEDRNEITLPSALLSTPMPQADPITFAIYEDLTKRWLAERSQVPDIVRETSDVIAGRLREGEADLDAVAASIGVSPRSLQRRLEQAGTTFEKVVAATRSDLAKRMLRDTDMPLTDIAHDLGYGDASAFTRAVRRWFKMSPRALRREVRR